MWCGSTRPTPHMKVPHMGWNDLVIDHPHPVLDGIATGDHAYFVHSYHFVVTDPHERLAHCDYGGDITAIVGTRQHRRHPVPPGKKPGRGAAADFQLSELDALKRYFTRVQVCLRHTPMRLQARRSRVLPFTVISTGNSAFIRGT